MKSRALSFLAVLLLSFVAIFATAQTDTKTPKTGAAKQAPATTEQSQTVRGQREAAKKAPAQAATQGQPWKRIPIPPLPAFHPKQPTRIQLDNGLIIFLQEDHELPLISLSMRIRGGSRLEPASKIGLVDLYGDVWRTGGTERYTGDQLDDFLEERAAKVETGSDVDSTAIGLNCLKGDFNAVFELMVDLLQHPAFREDKLVLAKRQMDTGISRRNDSIDGIAAREALAIGYGRNNPYARYPEYSTVAAATRQDLIDWHSRYVHPNNTILGVVGDFDTKEMEARLRETFSAWPRGPQVEPPEIAFRPPQPGFYYAPKEDVNQSEIQMVALGIERKNPDYFALSVMNEAFGGGMASRLFVNLRTKQGLAYSVGGGVGSGFDHPGLIRLAMGTKTATTSQGVEGLFHEVEDLVTHPITQEELSRAKDAILNAFVFNFDSPEKVLREQMRYEFYGYPLNFLDMYRDGVQKVTVADVNRVAQKYLHRNEFAVVVVGEPAAEKELAKLGPVKTLDITIPPPPGAAAEQGGAAPVAPKASNAEGKALVNKVVQFVGGAPKIDQVKALRQVLTSMQRTPQGEFPLEVDQTVVFPDRAYAKIATPIGEVTRVVAPEAAFMVIPGQGTQDMPASMRSEAVKQMRRDFLSVLQHINDPKYIFAANGQEKVDNTQAAVLDIDADGALLRWYVDPQTGRLLRATFTAPSSSGAPTATVVDYTDWKVMDGLNLPVKTVRTENGKPAGGTDVHEAHINPQVDPKVFAKPQS